VSSEERAIALAGQRTEDVVGALVPLMGIVFVAYLVVGAAMPVLPLYVHQDLGLGVTTVGVLVGSQFVAALMTRVWAGRYADMRGPRRAVVAGLLATASAGVFYLLSLECTAQPVLAAVVLVAGRAVLGAGESFIITGAQAWGLTLAGPAYAGRVLARMGVAMYAAFALGAPAGSALFGELGFRGIALATLLMPLATTALVLRIRDVTPGRPERVSYASLLVAIWRPGAGLAMASFGFGSMTGFASLLFASRGWAIWPAFTSFAVAFIAARLILGSLPDRIGGAKVATLFLVVEAVGLGLLYAAPSMGIALLGAMSTGVGYSLVFPGFGVVAIRSAPPQCRGLAVGVYTAFLDLTLAISSPILGAIGDAAGIGAIFLVSALIVLCALTLSIPLARLGDAR
jgi:MFS family permease